MCGLIAALRLGAHQKGNLADPLHGAVDLLKHCGPDGQRIWISSDQEIGFGHARLAIVDLSPAAFQPFHDYGHDIHIMVIGEIYNHRELRDSLRTPYNFTSGSDCEVVIPLYLEYGVSFLERLDGEFALCLYDGRQKQFLAAKDRHGHKPLFWTIMGGRLLVASETSAFRPFTSRRRWNVRSLFTDSWLRDDTTVYEDIHKVEPGNYITSIEFGMPQTKSWWRPQFPDKNLPDYREEADMIRELRRHLFQSILQRLHGEHPVAISLSGGLDSTIIAGMLSVICRNPALSTLDVLESNAEEPGAFIDCSAKNITCFTLSFRHFADVDCDESEVARNTARAIGAKHVIVDITEWELAATFEDATRAIDCMWPDMDYVCQKILARRVRERGFKGLLTGTGADDYFAGYPPFKPESARECDQRWSRASHYEDPYHHSNTTADELAAKLIAGFSDAGHDANPDKDPRARRLFGGASIEPFLWPVAHTDMPWAQWVRDKYGGISVPLERAQSLGLDPLSRFPNLHPMSRAQYAWIRQVLPTDLVLLGYSPHMTEGVESLTPMLSNSMTDFARSLPVRALINRDPATAHTGRPRLEDFWMKYILHRTATPYIPPQVSQRTKKAFTGPIRFTSNGPVEMELRRWVTKAEVENLGFFDWSATQSCLDRAFGKPVDVAALRSIIMVAQLVILSRSEDIDTACR